MIDADDDLAQSLCDAGILNESDYGQTRSSPDFSTSPSFVQAEMFARISNPTNRNTFVPAANRFAQSAIADNLSCLACDDSGVVSAEIDGVCRTCACRKGTNQ